MQLYDLKHSGIPRRSYRHVSQLDWRIYNDAMAMTDTNAQPVMLPSPYHLDRPSSPFARLNKMHSIQVIGN